MAKGQRGKGGHLVRLCQSVSQPGGRQNVANDAADFGPTLLFGLSRVIVARLTTVINNHQSVSGAVKCSMAPAFLPFGLSN